MQESASNVKSCFVFKSMSYEKIQLFTWEYMERSENLLNNMVMTLILSSSDSIDSCLFESWLWGYDLKKLSYAEQVLAYRISRET